MNAVVMAGSLGCRMSGVGFRISLDEPNMPLVRPEDFDRGLMYP
jgi:hypothetical protein